MFRTHKPGQAQLSRTVTLLGGLFLVAWGCYSLRLELASFRSTGPTGTPTYPLDRAWNEILFGAPSSAAWKIDLVVLQSNFSPAFTIAAAALLAAGLWWWWLMNRPKMADRLIDMEAELRKVSWPSFSDAWQSTLVVSGFTALIVVLVFVYDVVIKRVVDLMPVRRI